MQMVRLHPAPLMEEVVLVDEENNVIGTKPKAEVHTSDTPLHRGFSLFVFNTENELLVTKRSFTKKTFPGLWTNSCCGHPGPNEEVIASAKRRLKEELRIVAPNIKQVAHYRYRFADSNGVVENEICPILLAHIDYDPNPNPQEVEEWKWVAWDEFLKDIERDPLQYSPWCREEAKIIHSLGVL